MKTTEDLVKSVESTYKQGIELIKTKNKDYAGNGDPFENFKSARVIGLTVEEALLVRILDKLSRMGNLIRREAQVKDEKITDTIVDACNYLAILKAYLEDSCGNTE